MADIFKLGTAGLQAVEEKLELVEDSAKEMLGSINSPAVTIPKDGEVCFITNTAEETKAVNINGGGKDEGADIIAWPFGRAANERSHHHSKRNIHNVFKILSPYSNAHIGVKEEANRPNVRSLLVARFFSPDYLLQINRQGIKLINSATPALFAFEYVCKHESKATDLYKIKILGHTKNCVFTNSVYLTSLPGDDKNLNLLEAGVGNKHQLWEVEPEIP